MNKMAKWTISGAMAFSIVAPITIQASTEAVAASKKATVKVSAATIYKTTSKKNRLGTVRKGTTLTYSTKGAVWTKVKYKGKTGYILSKQLKFPQTAAEIYLNADAKGKNVKNALQILNEAEASGNMNSIYTKTYDALQSAISKYSKELDGFKLSKADRDRLKAKYIKPADQQLERLAGVYNSWNELNQTEKRMNNFDYDAAQKSFDRSITAYSETEAYIQDNNLSPLNAKLATKVKKRKDSLDRRFSYSTFSELQAIYTNSEVKKLTGTEKDIFKKAHSNGLITTEYLKEEFLFDIPIANERNKGGFKKLTFTVAAGEYWNKYDTDNDYLTNFGIYDISQPKEIILEPGADTMKITVDLENLENQDTENLSFYGEFERDVIISDIRLYR